MKSREIQASACLLMYHVPLEKQLKLQECTAELGLTCKIAHKSELNQTVGYLVDLPGYQKAECAAITNASENEFILFSGLAKGQMNHVLQRMRELKSVIALKAIVTEHNKNWTLQKLMVEVENEYRLMQLYEEYQRLLNKADQSSSKSIREFARTARANGSLGSYTPEEIRRKLDELKEVLKTN